MKEPFFLLDPAHPLARRPNAAQDGMEAYSSLFSRSDAGAQFRMEATTHYLFDPIARARIAGIEGSRAIAVLREPAMRVYSSFRYTANNLARLDPTLTFPRYLDLVERGVPLWPKWCRHEGSGYVLDRDVGYSRYASYVRPWMDAMGPSRFRVLIMEDLIRDVGTGVEQLLRWLDLDPSEAGPMRTEAKNRTEQVRIPSLQAFARKINAKMALPAFVRRSVKSAYGYVQFQGIKYPPQDILALERLRQVFDKDNTALAHLLGVDLVEWGGRDIKREFG